MTRSAPELWDLLREAYGLPYGGAQIAMFDQLLPHVDTSGDAELAYTARITATTAYTYGGEPAKAFVTFAWCLSEFDTNPAPYHARMEHTLLWDFKTMINSLLRFPEVPLDRTYAVIDDMERRYREGGHSLQAVYKQRYQVAEHIGDIEQADAWYERWVTAPRDDLSDCIGCDPSDKAGYQSLRGRDEAAVALAEPVLAGKLTCTEQPQTILNELMEPYLRTGRLAEAADAHRRAYRLQRHKLADLSDLGTHISFCARTGNEHRGLEILQRHVDWLDRAPSPAAEMRFAASAGLLLRRLTAIGHGDTTVRTGQRDVPARILADELAARATQISLRFDARNGTDAQSRQIIERLTADPYGVVLPLSPTARQAVPPVKSEPEVDTAAEPVIPAGADAQTLLELADRYQRDDREAAVSAVLAAFDAQFPDPDALGPLLAARRAVLRGGELWSTDHAAAARSWQDAIERFTAAAAEAEASSVRGRVGMAHCLDGRFDEGRALIESDLAYQQEHGDSREQAAAWSRLSNAYFLQDRPEDANSAQDRADALASETGEPRLSAVCALRRARNRAAAGRYEDAIAAAREALEFFREHGPTHRVGEAAAICGQLTDDPAEAVIAFGEVLTSGLDGATMAARVGRGRALIGLDRAAEAIPDLVEAVALSAELGLDEAGGYSRQDLANAYRLADRTIEAAEVAEEALAVFQQIGHEEPANDTRLLLAGLYRQLGENEAALTLYGDLLDRLADNPAGLGQIGEQRGQLLYDLDRDAEAADAFQVAADHLRRADDPVGELRLLRRRLMALHYADEVEQAEDVIRLAADRYAALPGDLASQPPVIWGRAMFGFESARMLMSRDRYTEALPHLKDGAGPLRTIGASDDADRVDIGYADALLRSGSPAAAEELLSPLLAAMRPDAPERANAAILLADALDELGRGAEATEVRSRAQLNDR